MPISRLSRVLKRSPRLFSSLCIDEEKAEFCSSVGSGLLWAACLWTAKEAAVKCLGTGFWRQGVEWTDLTVASLSNPQSFPQPERIQSSFVAPLQVKTRGVANKLIGKVYIIGTFEATPELAISCMHLYSLQTNHSS